jgi:hypothetical protein
VKAAYAVFAALLAIYLIPRGVRENVLPAWNEPHGDCEVDWIAARAWAMHWDPYSDEGFERAGISNLGHPPTTPFWFLPFRRLDLHQVHVATSLIVLFLLTMMLFVIGSELNAPALPASVALVFGFVLDQSWMQYHLAMMQVGVPTAFLMVMSWFFLRRRMEIPGGAMMGLACTFKFFPGLMMIWFLLTKRFRAFIAGAIAWLAIAITMTSRYGISSWGEYFAKQPEINNYWAANVKNGGLAGIVLRLWWHACVPRGPNLPAATAITITVSLVLIYWCWRVTRQAALDGSFALWSLLAVFLNPVIWEHYYVLLIFPWAMALALLVEESRAKMAPWKSALGTAVLTLIVGLLSLDMELKAHQNTRISGWHFRTHLFEVANWLPWLLLLGMLSALLYRQQRRNGRMSAP